MNDSFSKTKDQIGYWVLIFFVFLLPLISIKALSNDYQTPKFLLVLFTALGLVALIISGPGSLKRKLKTQQRPVVLFGLAFLLAYTAAMIFSKNVTSSIFGIYGRIGSSWLAFSCYGIIAWSLFCLISKKNISTLVDVFLGSFALVSLIGIAQRLGWDPLGLSNDLNQPLSTIGSPEWLSIIGAALIPLSLRKISQGSPLRKYLLPVFAVIYLIAIVAAKSWIGWILLAIVLVARLILSMWQTEKPSALSLWAPLLASGVLFVVFATPLLNFADWPIDYALVPFKEGWRATALVLKDFPLLGGGPETFSFTYSLYRPLSTNLGQGWSVTAQYPHNEFFSIFASAGFIGIILLVVFLASLLRRTLAFAPRGSEDGQSEPISSPIQLSLIILIIALVLGGFDVTVWSLFWILVGSLLAINASDTSTSDEIHEPIPTTDSSEVSSSSPAEIIPWRLALAGGIFVLGIIAIGRYALADKHFSSAVSLPDDPSIEDFQKSYDDAQQARKYNGLFDVYYRLEADKVVGLAQIESSALQQQLEGAGLSDEEIQQQQREAYISIRDTYFPETERLLQKAVSLNDINSDNYSTLADVYNLFSLSEDVSPQAVSYYEWAMNLNPTNHRYPYSLAVIYANYGYSQEALSWFSQSISLKQDFASGYYDRAQVLKAEAFYAEALTDLRIVQQIQQAQGSTEEIDAQLQKEISDLETLIQSTEDASVTTPTTTEDTPTDQPDVVSPDTQLEEPEIPPTE